MDQPVTLSEKARLTIRELAMEVVSMGLAAGCLEPREREINIIARLLGAEAPAHEVIRQHLKHALLEQSVLDSEMRQELWDAAGHDLKTLLLGLHAGGNLPLQADFVSQYLDQPNAQVRILRSSPLETLVMGVKRTKVVVDRVHHAGRYAEGLFEFTQIRWDLMACDDPILDKELRKIMSPKERAWYRDGMLGAAQRFAKGGLRPRSPRRQNPEKSSALQPRDR
jgi:hypothetical protein